MDSEQRNEEMRRVSAFVALVGVAFFTIGAWMEMGLGAALIVLGIAALVAAVCYAAAAVSLEP